MLPVPKGAPSNPHFLTQRLEIQRVGATDVNRHIGRIVIKDAGTNYSKTLIEAGKVLRDG
jgi:hypothetical protein